MAEVAITLKLTADEFQTLREELKDHAENLRGYAKAHRSSGARGQADAMTKREARVTFILEKLG